MIGTLCATLSQAPDTHVSIFSSDKDFKQLLRGEKAPDESIVAMDETTFGSSFNGVVDILKPPKKGSMEPERITAASFTDSSGIVPDQYGDMLALVGDRVDNLPGARGIGKRERRGE